MMKIVTWLGTFFPVSVFPATTKWENDDTLHTTDKKYDDVFLSLSL